ncbi:ATPase morc2 [Parelaphostrongylus tenuis]|uniref:ATPase morc2 n=1 Tax=Parelaphostrongylus tenuis TaxID=148309 RepID=A0AAD5WJH2_PARTN|nr:ATPase morc2 [Parelaphostrongylus tenuis]
MASESPSNDSNNGFDTSIFHKATISYEYLHTNSTTHEFVYGAIAELVDNSRDAMANNLHIDFTPNDEYGGLLSILDDGCGMDRKEAISVVSFGHSLKRMEPGMIGQYGNGLKSGAMRIAKDFIMFTKKDGLLTCLLLSRTFHEKYSLKEVFVPVASFTLENGSRAMYCDSHTQAKMHSQSMDVIYNHTPFDSQDALFEQFERISGTSGTLIVLFNLRRIETGDFELNFDSPYDVRLSNFEEQRFLFFFSVLAFSESLCLISCREEERNSLRAYLSVLYLNPRMKVYLRGKKVLTTRILSTLLYPYKYNYTAKNLKTCAIKEFERCEQKVREVKEMLRMSSSALGEFEAKYRGQNIHANKTLRMEQRLLVKARSDLEAKKEHAEKQAASAVKAKNNPTPLVFYFGLNIHHRNRYGCMLYNNGRLIEMYVKVAVQKEKNDLLMKCLGVVGVVDVPYSILEPTHNKQSFENKREYLSLLRAMNDHMEQYWKDINLAGNEGPSGVKSFWKNFGYENSDWSSECTNLAEFRKKRYLKIGHTVQCDKCLKWRHVDYHASYEINGIPENWCCNDHPNGNLRGCSKPEEVPKVKEGKLVRQKSPDSSAKRYSSPSGRGMERKPDSHSRVSSTATANGNGLARRTSSPAVKSVTSSSTRNSKEAQHRPPTPPPSRPLKRSSRTTMRKESESESSPERPPRKTSNKASNVTSKTTERISAVGRPPMKRAAAAAVAKRRIVSDEDTDEEEIIVPQESSKRAKTKADLRKQYEEKEERQRENEAPSNVQASAPEAPLFHEAKPSTSSLPPSNPSTSEKKLFTSTQPPSKPMSEPLSNGTATKYSIDKETFEREKERADRAVGQTRKLLNFFVKQGVSYAERFRKMGESELMEQDMEQFGRNLWEEHVLKVVRERDELKLLRKSDKEQIRKLCEDELRSELTIILKWAMPDDEVTYENCFEMKNKLIGMLNADLEEDDEPSEQSEMFVSNQQRPETIID